MLSSLDYDEAYGPDGVSSAVLDNCAIELAPYLVTLCNLILEQYKVSTYWKVANFLPAHNKRERDPVSNYRTVLLLSIVSEVIRKCIHNHVNIITNNMICSEQHGFLKG